MINMFIKDVNDRIIREDIMGTGSVKEKARKYYLKHPEVTLAEFKDIFKDQVLPRTINKYLIQFRQMYGVQIDDVPDEISIKKLEKELSLQLERNPTSTVIKSCIDFLKLKAMTDGQVDEFDMTIFIKKGKTL